MRQNETICALLSQQNAVLKDMQAQVSGLRDIVREHEEKLEVHTA